MAATITVAQIQAIARMKDQLSPALANIEKNASATATKVAKAGKRMGDAGKRLSTFVTLPLAAAGAAAIKWGADAAESASKLEAVFGPATDRVNKSIAAMRDTIPATTSELQDMHSGIQDLLVPLGLAPTEAERMTASVVRLAGDLGSFNNVPVAEALADIRSGLVGSNEPLLKYGVAIDVATTKARAMELGLYSGTGALDASARAQAAYSLILEKTTAAQGDAAKTAGSAANQFKFLLKDAKNLGETFGKILLPVVTPIVSKLVDMVRWIENLSPGVQAAIVVIAGLAAAAGPLLVAFGAIAPLLPTLAAGFAVLTGPIGLIVTALAALRDGALRVPRAGGRRGSVGDSHLGRVRRPLAPGRGPR